MLFRFLLRHQGSRAEMLHCPSWPFVLTSAPTNVDLYLVLTVGGFMDHCFILLSFCFSCLPDRDARVFAPTLSHPTYIPTSNAVMSANHHLYSGLGQAGLGSSSRDRRFRTRSVRRNLARREADNFWDTNEVLHRAVRGDRLAHMRRHRRSCRRGVGK